MSLRQAGEVRTWRKHQAAVFNFPKPRELRIPESCYCSLNQNNGHMFNCCSLYVHSTGVFTRVMPPVRLLYYMFIHFPL